MNLWGRIKRLSIRQLWKLSWLFLKHPLYIFPTLNATKKTFETCNQLFGNEHNKSNQANAFRHALWNYLICRKTLKYSKNEEKSAIWTQKVTDLYEKVTQNDLLDEAMDVHNNKIGRLVFLDNLNKKETEMIHLLQKMSENARKISKVEDIGSISNQLVYISE